MRGRCPRLQSSIHVILSFLLVAFVPAGFLRAEEPAAPHEAGDTQDPAAPVAPSVEAIEEQDWQPAAPFPDKFDWIELKSGEWLKGEFIALYKDSLEFDSDELDLLTFDWVDVRQVRTARVMDVGLPYKRKVTGRLWIQGDKVLVIGDEVRELRRAQIVSITSGSPSEFKKWAGKVSLGVTVQKGNTDQIDMNNQMSFKRRTVEDRVNIDYVANYSKTSGIITADNQRLKMNWDKFLTQRFFVDPLIFEWYRDPFTNISSRTTYSVAAGYQLIDTKRTDWSVSGGPGYQETHFDSVQAGMDRKTSTGALIVETDFDQDWTKDLEFKYQYRAQFTNEASGKYNHHMVMTFETEWTSVLDFDLTMVWDRTENPQPDDQGVVPEQDDFRMIVSLGIEF